ncbi:MAG: sigma 54-interacting transcriptional regulator, partial [Nitrosomonas sp.]|uniref:sigma 54-interacting transcriptional regulator n=1 Tax=Nitrosomonas sp. TaxID=42353 RepID=UPI0025CF3CCD
MIDAFKILFQNSPLFVAMLDDALICREINSTWRNYLNLNAADTVSLSVAELLADLHQDSALMHQIEQVANRGHFIKEAPATLLTKNHFTQPVHKGIVSAWRIQSPHAKQVMVLLVFGDIVEHSQTFNELRHLQTIHELLLNAAGEGVYGVDNQGNTIFVNEAATRILGWRSVDVIGKPLHDIHHHSYPDGSPYPSSECPIYTAFKDGKVRHGDDEVFWHTNGTAIPVEYTSTPILEDNRIKGAVVIFRDISERKKNEQQREIAYEQIKTLKELLEHERDYLRDEINITINFGEIIGESQVLKRTLTQIEAVAKMPTSVLILGESGVGKEMIARAIHLNSTRASKQLVKVNCASIPKNLFESEFFGHVRGSFTGAHRDRVGRFHLAAGGTLFLDEIGDLPMDLQVNLLRFLQEKTIERVGGTEHINV